MPHLVIQGRFRLSPNNKTAFDIAPDGKRFLRIQQVQPELPLTHLDVVLNWIAEVRGAASGK